MSLEDSKDYVRPFIKTGKCKVTTHQGRLYLECDGDNTNPPTLFEIDQLSQVPPVKPVSLSPEPMQPIKKPSPRPTKESP